MTNNFIFPGYDPDSQYRYVRFASGGLKTQNPREFIDAYTLPTEHPTTITDAYCGLFLFTEDLYNYHIENGKDKGYRGPHDAKFIPIDIDSKDPEELPALLEKTKFFLGKLEDQFEVMSNHLQIFFSGNRGFHILIPTALITYEPDPKLHIHIKDFCSKLCEGSLDLDKSIYDQQRMLRLPNSRHSKSNLLKIQLTGLQIFELGIDEIKDKAEEKVAIVSPDIDPEKKNAKLQQLWDETKPVGKSKVRPKREPTTEHHVIRWLCIEKMLEGVSETDPSRNGCALRIACHFKNIGCKKAECQSELTEWNFKNTPPLPEEEIEKVVESAYSGEYRFKCIKESTSKDAILEHFCNDDCTKVGRLKELLDDVRYSVDENGNRKSRPVNNDLILKISEIVYDYLCKKGMFAVHKGDSYYVSKGIVYASNSTKMQWLLIREAGLVPSEREGKGVLSYLNAVAKTEGKPIKQFGATFLDTTKHILYVNTQKINDPNILKISPDAITKIENGEDGVLLRQSDQNKPWEYIEDADINKAFKMMIDLIWKNLSCERHAKTMMLSYALSAFIKEYTIIHPIMKATGPKESGKSAGQRLISHLIYGDDELRMSTASAAYSDGNNLCLFLDNLEDPKPDIKDLLITTATGNAKVKRRMGTNSDTITERIYSLIFVNSISPFYIPELIQRTIDISFSTDYYDNSYNYNDIKQKIFTQRSYMLSGLMKFISSGVLNEFKSGTRNTILEYMKERFPGHEKQRINDFLVVMYLFFERICNILDIDFKSEWETAITTLIESEKDYQAETNDLLLMLEHLKKEWDIKQDTISGVTAFRKEYGFDPIYPPRGYKDLPSFLMNPTISFSMQVTMADLFFAFSKLCKNYGIKFQYGTSKGLSSRFESENKTLLLSGWQRHVVSNHRNKSMWSIQRFV